MFLYYIYISCAVSLTLYYTLYYYILTHYNFIYITLVNLNIQVVNIVLLIILIVMLLQRYKIFLVGNIFIWWYFNSIIMCIKKNIILLYVKTLPITLLIGLNNIHPLLYYYGVLLFITFIKSNNLVVYNLYTLKYICYILVLSLLLGMHWGSINNVWGFFWVKDYIELILLYWVLCVILTIHLYSNSIQKYFLYIICLVIISIIISIRFGLLNTRHSFFLNLQISSYPMYLFYIMYIYLIYFSVLLLVKRIVWYLLIFVFILTIYFLVNYILYVVVVVSLLLLNTFINYIVLNIYLLVIHSLIISTTLIWGLTISHNIIVYSSLLNFTYSYIMAYLNNYNIFSVFQLFLYKTIVMVKASTLNIIYSLPLSIYTIKLLYSNIIMYKLIISYVYIFILLLYIPLLILLIWLSIQKIYSS